MMGQLVTMNQRLDRDSLEMICDEFEVDFRFEDEYGTDIIEQEMEQYADIEEEPRPPVVTIMGRVATLDRTKPMRPPDRRAAIR